MVSKIPAASSEENATWKNNIEVHAGEMGIVGS